MATTVRTFNEHGKLVAIRMSGIELRPNRRAWRLFDDLDHPTISTTNVYEQNYQRYVYLQEQLALNSIRTGANLVDAERTRHILEGSPILRAINTKFGEETDSTTTVCGWSGGHANPAAAQYGKTQIPEFWTSDRFMYEVSDILIDDRSKWYLQVEDNLGKKKSKEDDVPRYVCVEERYGVPIRVVAERVDDSLKCVTAFPDYSELSFDENLRVFSANKE